MPQLFVDQKNIKRSRIGIESNSHRSIIFHTIMKLYIWLTMARTKLSHLCVLAATHTLLPRNQTRPTNAHTEIIAKKSPLVLWATMEYNNSV